MASYKAFAGQIIEIDPCRCGAAPTHFLIRPVEPERWRENGRMEILARSYCDACSPAVDHSQSPGVVMAQPIDPPASWMVRWISRWLSAPSPTELET